MSVAKPRSPICDLSTRQCGHGKSARNRIVATGKTPSAPLLGKYEMAPTALDNLWNGRQAHGNHRRTIRSAHSESIPCSWASANFPPNIKRRTLWTSSRLTNVRTSAVGTQWYGMSSYGSRRTVRRSAINLSAIARGD